MPRRITNVTARFNIEARPFQHVRVEVAAIISKDDDANEVREELVTYAKDICHDIMSQIYHTPNNRLSKTSPHPYPDDELPMSSEPQGPPNVQRPPF